MNDTNEKITSAGLLVGVWAIASTVLHAFDLINNRRDAAFTLVDKCGLCSDCMINPSVIYWTNMIPLSFGILLFLLLAIYLVWQVRKANVSNIGTGKRVLNWLLTFLIFSTVGFFLGDIFDYHTLKDFISLKLVWK